MRLYKKKWRVRVDTIETTSLDVAFEIEKTLGAEPNKLSLKLFNLSASHRAQLAQLSTFRQHGPQRIRVEVEAGYESGTSLLFRGDVRTAVTIDERPTWVTSLEGEDGGQAVLWSRVNRSFPAGTPVATVVRACAQAMGVGAGNTDSALASARFVSGGNVFSAGTVLSGPAPDALQEVLRSLGLTYSVQDGVLQILERGRALQATAVRLTSGANGLTEPPVRHADGKVTLKSLLIPDLYPGRKVQLEHENIHGIYRVKKAKYTGDSAGQDWYVSLECDQPRS